MEWRTWPSEQICWILICCLNLSFDVPVKSHYRQLNLDGMKNLDSQNRRGRPSERNCLILICYLSPFSVESHCQQLNPNGMRVLERFSSRWKSVDQNCSADVLPQPLSWCGCKINWSQRWRSWVVKEQMQSRSSEMQAIESDRFLWYKISQSIFQGHRKASMSFSIWLSILIAVALFAKLKIVLIDAFLIFLTTQGRFSDLTIFLDQ